VVVNERTGTVVSGGDVRLGEVSVAQGDLKVDITTDYNSFAADRSWKGRGQVYGPWSYHKRRSTSTSRPPPR